MTDVVTSIDVTTGEVRTRPATVQEAAQVAADRTAAATVSAAETANRLAKRQAIGRLRIAAATDQNWADVLTLMDIPLV